MATRTPKPTNVFNIMSQQLITPKLPSFSEYSYPTVSPNTPTKTATLEKPRFSTNDGSRKITIGKPVTVVKLTFTKEEFLTIEGRQRGTIRALTSDGNVVLCRIERCESHEYARNLWSALNDMQKSGTPIRLIAAGNNSPTMWFFDYEAV